MSAAPMAQDRPAPPRHVAIVMDGNGRWAKKRFLPRFFGHKQGVDTLVKVVQACIASDEPVPARIDEPFILRFVPESTLAQGDEIELSEADCDTLPYDGKVIELGEAVAETLALALDPFPRSPGAEAASGHEPSRVSVAQPCAAPFIIPHEQLEREVEASARVELHERRAALRRACDE